MAESRRTTGSTSRFSSNTNPTNPHRMGKCALAEGPFQQRSCQFITEHNPGRTSIKTQSGKYSKPLSQDHFPIKIKYFLRWEECLILLNPTPSGQVQWLCY